MMHCLMITHLVPVWIHCLADEQADHVLCSITTQFLSGVTEGTSTSDDIIDEDDLLAAEEGRVKREVTGWIT